MKTDDRYRGFDVNTERGTEGALLEGLTIDLGDNLRAHLDAKGPLSESYFDLVEEVYNHVNLWSLGSLDRPALYANSRIVVLTKDDEIVGGFTSDVTPNPEVGILDRFTGQDGVPPLELVSQHKNIAYNLNLLLTGSAREMRYRKAIRDLTIAIPKLGNKEFAIVTAALRPHRLDLLYKLHGFSAVSGPLFSPMYARFDGDAEPNCIIMMRSIHPFRRLSEQLLQFGRT